MVSKHGVSFRQMITGERFFYGAELVTTRGIGEPGKPSKLVELGEALAADPRIGWISVTDNPGGHPMLPPDWLGRILASKAVELVIHLTCKDLNRNGLESAAWRYAAEGFENLLALTGDLPASGFGGIARPVFDLDSVGLIALLHAMNQGLEIPGRSGKPETLARTNFFLGAAVSPFKRHERELMPQFFKLARKIKCGADWVIPQLGYDMRKFQEVKHFLAWAKVSRPIIGNVYILNKTVAGLFNRNQIAGCVVSDELNAQVQKYAAGPDKGSRFFLELAAKQLAVFKGMGFAAGYLAGSSKPETFARIIDMAEGFGADDWKEFAREIQFPQKDEFYLFEKDPQTGLSDGQQLSRSYLDSLRNPPKTKNVTLGYRLNRKIHEAAFTPGQGQFGTMQKLYGRLEKHKDGLAIHALHSIERVSKNIGFGCKDCGDCSLPDCAYLCPNTACSKGSRNGPCGGSFDGNCERGDKPCLWTRAYERLKYYGESEHMLDGPAVFTDGRLEGTSAWANTFLGRDHHHAPAAAPPASPSPAAAPAAASAPKPSTPMERKSMPLDGLTLIGESINDSVPSTKKLFDANDIAGLENLARSQDQAGAAYIDVNVGSRPAAFLAEMVGRVQSVTAKPLSIDTPDPAMAEAGLKAYNLQRAGGQIPVLNSISPLRLAAFELCKIQPFKPILLVSERLEGGKALPNHTAQEVYETAKEMLAQARKHGIPNEHCIIDPAIAPIGSDSEGHLRRLIDAMRLIHADPAFKGVHMSVGLSNFTVMLPSKRADGLPVKGPLESAFLTLAMPLGLDHIIGSVQRKYQLLPPDHPAMICIQECLKLEGFDVIMRVQEFYAN